VTIIASQPHATQQPTTMAGALRAQLETCAAKLAQARPDSWTTLRALWQELNALTDQVPTPGDMTVIVWQLRADAEDYYQDLLFAQSGDGSDTRECGQALINAMSTLVNGLLNLTGGAR
jgi:hypothetical protein